LYVLCLHSKVKEKLNTSAAWRQFHITVVVGQMGDQFCVENVASVSTQRVFNM